MLIRGERTCTLPKFLKPGTNVFGRKNHYGSKSKRRTEVAALFYTLFETAKLSEVDPRAYVTLAAKRAIADHGTVTLPSDLT